MDWLAFVVHWLHVLLGIFWFGSTLFLDFVLIPVVTRQPPETQQAISQGVGRIMNPLITYFVAPGVILLGVLRGTVFGGVRSIDDLLGTAYGLTWLAALVIAIGVYAGGILEIRPRVTALNEGRVPESELPAFLTQLRAITLVELVGFLLIFTLMVLMRFGL